MSILKLKKNRFSQIQEIQKTVESSTAKKYEDDGSRWKLAVDKTGSGSAVIRFLPPKDGENVPYQKYYEHAFKNEKTGKWLISRCRTSIDGGECPVCDHNSELWATGDAEKQAIVRERKRKLKYVTNIYVVKDPANTENEGKVFKFVFGAKIFEKIVNAMTSDDLDPDSPNLNPWDMWYDEESNSGGANFKLTLKKVEGWPNYDTSKFLKPANLSEDDDELEKIYSKVYSLTEEVSESNPEYLSYDKLKTRLDEVLGLASKKSVKRDSEEIIQEEDDEEEELPVAKTKKIVIEEDDDEELDLEKFKMLAAKASQ